MARKKIVVADDSRTIRLQVQRLLHDAGYETHLAQNGREAVELAQSVHPQLVILDIQMPEMDGYEACDRILQLPDVEPSLRFLFLTNDQGQHLEQLGRQFGAYLRKPLDSHSLIRVVHQLAGPAWHDKAPVSVATV